MIFRIPDEEEFRFRGESSKKPQNLISAVTAIRLIRNGCQGFLVVVRDTTAETRDVCDVPVVCEYSDVFPEELPGLPHDREIEFCIDLVPGTTPISIPPYRMATTELKELNEQL